MDEPELSFWWLYCMKGLSTHNGLYDHIETEKRSGTQITISGSTITIILVPKITEDEHLSPEYNQILGPA